jgi:hypothetical protein
MTDDLHRYVAQQVAAGAYDDDPDPQVQQTVRNLRAVGVPPEGIAEVLLSWFGKQLDIQLQKEGTAE